MSEIPNGAAGFVAENQALRARVAALELEARRCRATLYSVRDAVLSTDLAGAVVQMNRMAECLTGWTEAEAQGIPLGQVLRIVSDEGGDGGPHVSAQVAERGELLARDGTQRAVASTSASIADEAGGVIGSVIVVRDQADETRAERELREGERRFRTFFDNAPIGKSMTAPDGKLLRVNRAFGAMLGYSIEEMQTLSFAAITHPDDLAESRECVRSLLAGECGTWVMDKRYLAKDGRDVWTHVTTALERDEEGMPLYFLTHIQDISELKAAEQALLDERASLERRIVERTAELQRSKDLLDETGRLAKVGGWEIDLLRNELVWTDVVREVHEVGPDYRPQLETAINFYAPEAVPVITDAVQRAIEEKEPFDVELPLITARGRRIWVRAIGRAHVENGVVVRVGGVFQDLTERKRIEDAVVQKRRLLRQVIDTVPSHITVKNQDGICLLANMSRAHAYGTTVAVLEGTRDDDDRSAVSEEAAARFAAGLDVIQQKRASIVAEERFTYADRSVHWMFTTRLPIIEADGSCTQFLVVATDVTELKEHREHLEELVAERTAELQVLNETLNRSNKELEQFAYVASHDLQEPLRMVSSYTQLLEQRYKDKLDQDAKDFIGYAVDGANRMQRLIQDLLSFSRVTTHGQPPEPVDLHDALGDAVKNLQAAIEETGTVVTNDELPQVVGDRTQLVLVLQNLIANAIKFHKPDEAPRVHLSARRDPGDSRRWLVRVADNGIGIDPKYFDRLFVIFQRLHTRRDYPGTGIGLALCKRIVERHGGAVYIESEPGNGATFVFTLPGAEQQKEVAQ